MDLLSFNNQFAYESYSSFEGTVDSVSSPIFSTSTGSPSILPSQGTLS